MKKTITLICISLLLTISFYAQRGKENWEKIKALKIAYITEQVDLTSEEAEKFWPIYNAHSKNENKKRNSYRKALRNHLKSDKSLKNISENEAEELITLKLTIDKQLYELQKKLIKDIKQIIPHKKIIKLQLAEMEFGRKLMRKYKRKKPNPKE